MYTIELSKKYVNAFMATISENQVETILNQIMALINGFLASPKSKDFFSNPLVDATNKKLVISQVLRQCGASKECERFFYLLIDKNRMSLLKDLKAQFNTVHLEIKNEIDAKIFTSTNASLVSQETFLNHAKQYTDRKIRAEFIEDPSILGGYRIRLNDQVIDGTINNTLDKLKKLVTQ